MREDNLTFLATTCNPTCRLRLDKYIDGYYTIQFMERGRVALAYDDRWQQMEGAWFWPAYPGPRLRFQPADPDGFWFHRHVGFRGPLVQQWIAEGWWPTEVQAAPQGIEYASRFDDLIHLSKAGDRWAKLRAINLLEQILIELAEERAPTARKTSWLQTVLTELENQTPVDYAVLARKSGMAQSTLRRRFREATGISMQEYVIQARMLQARSLLAETDLPLTAIAEQLGYCNVYFFARQFKQEVGMPPGQFRRTRQR